MTDTFGGVIVAILGILLPILGVLVTIGVRIGGKIDRTNDRIDKTNDRIDKTNGRIDSAASTLRGESQKAHSDIGTNINRVEEKIDKLIFHFLGKKE